MNVKGGITIAVAVWTTMLLGCNGTGSGCDGLSTKANDTVFLHDTVSIHDTILSLPEGEFVYNLPCKVINIHQEKEGKSLLFIWLHGGVNDRQRHDLLDGHPIGFPTHLDYCGSDDSVINYLKAKNIKAIALLPVCHKAENPKCVFWKDCFVDVMRMIRDYVDKGVVDPKRIYLAGSSYGGAGTWDYLTENEHVFAAAIPMSCRGPRKTTIPVYFFNTLDEPDCTSQVDKLNKEGSNITYKRSPVKHGHDDTELTHEFLDVFFSNIKND